jgi:hypothetical protein
MRQWLDYGLSLTCYVQTDTVEVTVQKYSYTFFRVRLPLNTCQYSPGCKHRLGECGLEDIWHLENGNEPSGPINFEELLDYPSSSKVLCPNKTVYMRQFFCLEWACYGFHIVVSQPETWQHYTSLGVPETMRIVGDVIKKRTVQTQYKWTIYLIL